MGKFIFILLLIAGSYFSYTNGLLTAVTNGNIPQAGRVCEACGPVGGDAYFAFSKDDIALPIDSTLGFSSRDRAPAVARLSDRIANKRILCLEDNSKIKVIAPDKIRLHGCMYRVVRVKLLEGPYKGREGWMLREDVIDTPLQAVIQKFRPGKGKIEREMDDFHNRRGFYQSDD